jgi:site-specific recombinase XerD
MPQLKERAKKIQLSGKLAPDSELRELANRYLSWMAATRYSEETIKGSLSDMSWLLRYLERQGIDRIADVTTEILEDYSLCLRRQRNTRHEDRKISLAQVMHR